MSGEAKPAKVTVCDDSHPWPSIEGKLSSPDLAGKLCPVVPAGIPPPVGPVDPVGPCGMTSPSDLTSIGPVVPGSDPVGPVGPYIARERKAWRRYCASIYRKRFGPMGVRRDELLSDESDCEHTYHVAGRQYLYMTDGMDLMRPTAHRLSRSEISVDVETRTHVDNDPDDPDQVDIGRDVRGLEDAVPVMFDRTAVVPLALPVVVQTRPQVGCDPDLPLAVYKGQESLMEDGPGDIVSGRESIIKRSDVRRELCVVSDQDPVVVPKLAAVPIAVPVVLQTRPQVGCGPDLPLPVDEGQVSLDDDGPDVIFKISDEDIRCQS